MGRRIPTSEIHIIHPILSFSLLAAGMAAAIALISGLCGVRCRKRSSSPSPSSSKLERRDDFPHASTTTLPSSSSSSQGKEVLDENEAAGGDNNNADEQLRLPPAMTTKRAIKGTYSFKDLKVAASLSMKLTRSLSMARMSKEESSSSSSNYGGKKGKLLKSTDHQDSIWMKTIILGEKCRVPEREEEAVIYEGQGRKISAYHPRTASSLSISRQSSFIDQEAIPSRCEVGY